MLPGIYSGSVISPAKDISQYMRMYQFDYKKSNCSKYDFEFMKIG